MNAPTVGQLAATNPPSVSLWDFLIHLPTTMEAQIFMGLCLGGAVGLVGHFFFKWATGDIKGSLGHYLFVDNPRRSWLAMGLLVSELAGEMGTGLFTTSSGEFVGWAIVLISGLKSGYTIDSLANKSERPVWTEEQRDQSQQPKAALPVTADKN